MPAQFDIMSKGYGMGFLFLLYAIVAAKEGQGESITLFLWTGAKEQ